jgi:hypothetical protein
MSLRFRFRSAVSTLLLAPPRKAVMELRTEYLGFEAMFVEEKEIIGVR